MKTTLSVALLLLFGIGVAKAQTGANCNDALPFCTGTNYTFPNSTNVPNLGNVSCLGSTPNPIWYYMQVAQGGNIDITMNQTGNGGGGLDVDFAVWGPFASQAAGCGNPFPPGNPVDCSYSTAATEVANIPNAPAGSFYVLLITNFSNQPGTISFNQTGGTGTTNCGILAGGSSNGPICAGQTLQLTATAVPNATYSWTGPGGFSSTQQNPTIPNATVANSGNYTLIVTGPTGSDTAIIEGIVKPLPTAAFSATPLVCLGTPTMFSANGSQPVPGINTYQWIFNNAGVVNQTTTTPNTQFTYPAAGTYNTSVIVTANGCKDTAFQQVVVSPLPVANFTMDPKTCEEKMVTLNASGSTVAAPALIAQYRWDYNNDATVDLSIPAAVHQHAFVAGTHTVKLTVATNASCTASVTKTIQVFPYPDLDFTFNDACADATTEFTNASTPQTTVYHWDFGTATGDTSNAVNPTLIYPGLGTYDVTLIGTVGGICADTLQKQLVIANDVTAAFSFNEPCGLTGIFTDESTIPQGASGTITTWNWDFGDGATSYDQNPTHDYTANNINNVTLIVTTAEGCHDTITHQVPKYAIPVADFTAPNVCQDKPTLFIDSSSVTSGIIQSWFWSFGDSATSTDAVALHTYDTAGTYPLMLIVTTENGCSDTAYSSTQVYPNPIAAFATIPASYTTLLEPEVVFGDASIGATSWLWTVGSVGSTNEQKPIWTFEATGTYVITLLVTNEYGCTDEAKQDFTVIPAYNFFAPNSFTPQNGDNLNAYWRVYTLGMKEMTLRIYNRWGELLYATQDPLFMWDGKYKGKQLPQDEYIYKADTRDIEGKQYQYYGTIMLLQ